MQLILILAPIVVRGRADKKVQALGKVVLLHGIEQPVKALDRNGSTDEADVDRAGGRALSLGMLTQPYRMMAYHRLLAIGRRGAGVGIGGVARAVHDRVHGLPNPGAPLLRCENVLPPLYLSTSGLPRRKAES